jgi:hypothetical protein
LQQFLKELHDLLVMVVEHPRGTWLVLDRHAEMHAAWQEIQPRFADLRRELDQGNTDAQLSEAGLTGAPLRFKMAGWKQAFERFIGRPGRTALRLALKWANIALGSLATIFGAAEPIKEFKEAMEAEVEDRGIRRKTP